MTDDVLGAVEIFYDSVGDTYNYEEALKAYSLAADDTAVAFTAFYPITRKITIHGAHNLDAEALEGWRPSKVKCEAMELMIKAASTIPVCVPIMRRTVVPDNLWESSNTYERVAKRWGYHDDGSSILSKNILKITTCGFVRLPGQTGLSTDALAAMAYMNKHLVRATALQQRLSETEQLLIQSSHILDLVEFGIVLFGADRKVQYANAAASRIFEANDGLSCHAGQLSIQSANTHDRFQTMLRLLCDPSVQAGDQVGGMLSVPRRALLGSYILTLVPVRESGPVDSGISGIAFIADPRQKQITAISLLAKTYAFTKTEAELAIALLNGHTLSAIADQRGVSYNTVKTHLQAIFSKTHTRRQAELISLLLRSMAGVNIKPTN